MARWNRLGLEWQLAIAGTVIVAILAYAAERAVTAWNVRTVEEHTRRMQLWRMDDWARAGIAYRTEHDGRCPTMDQLVSIAREARDGEPPITVDRWSRSLAVRCEGRTVVVRAAGDDGVFGTQDDVATSARP